MNHHEAPYRNRRVEIAMQNRQRILGARDRRAMMGTFGILAYLGASNLIIGGSMFLGDTGAWLDGALTCAFGAMFSYAAMRVWTKDDTRWRIVLVPAGLWLALSVLVLLSGNVPPLVATALCLALPVFAALRRKTLAALRSTENALRPDRLPA
jgi:hypothetical protein